MKKILSIILIFVILSSWVMTISADENLLNYKSNETELINYVIKKFKDIKENDWYISYVIKLISKNIIAGKPQADGTVIFDPMGLVTKSEFTKMLVEAMDYNITDGNTFNDIGYENHWAKKYIETAVKEDVIDPEEEGENYWPNKPIKRKEMALMMFKALKLVPSNNKSPFPDINEGFATKLHEEYLLTGIPSGNTVIFNPEGLTTRAEVAAIIARLVEYKDNPKKYKEKKQWDDVTEDGVPMRLYLMEIDGKTIEERYNQLINELNYPTPPWENFSMKYYERTPEETAKAMYETAKKYMNIEYNIDYRTVDESYEENIMTVISKNNWGKYIAYDIRDFKERKIVLESEFYTAENLLYTIETKNGVAGGDYLRGTLKFRYSEPTSKSYLESIKDINGNSLKTGQWYEQDIDVKVGRDPARTAYIIVPRIIEVTKPKPIESR